MPFVTQSSLRKEGQFQHAEACPTFGARARSTQRPETQADRQIKKQESHSLPLARSINLQPRKQTLLATLRMRGICVIPAVTIAHCYKKITSADFLKLLTILQKSVYMGVEAESFQKGWDRLRAL